MILKIVNVVEAQLTAVNMSDYQSINESTYTDFAETSRCQALFEDATVVTVIVQAPIPAQVFVIEKNKQWHYIEISPTEFVGFREISREDFVDMFGADMLGDIVAEHFNSKLKL